MTNIMAEMTFRRPLRWSYQVRPAEMVFVNLNRPVVRSDAMSWRLAIEGDARVVGRVVRRIMAAYPGRVEELAVFRENGEEYLPDWAMFPQGS